MHSHQLLDHAPCIWKLILKPPRSLLNFLCLTLLSLQQLLGWLESPMRILNSMYKESFLKVVLFASFLTGSSERETQHNLPCAGLCFKHQLPAGPPSVCVYILLSKPSALLMCWFMFAIKIGEWQSVLAYLFCLLCCFLTTLAGTMLTWHKLQMENKSKSRKGCIKKISSKVTQLKMFVGHWYFRVLPDPTQVLSFASLKLKACFRASLFSTGLGKSANKVLF